MAVQGGPDQRVRGSAACIFAVRREPPVWARLQEERLALLESLLRSREEECVQLNSHRLEHLWGRRQAERDRQLRRSRARHTKGEGEAGATPPVWAPVCSMPLPQPYAS